MLSANADGSQLWVTVGSPLPSLHFSFSTRHTDSLSG